MDMGGDDKEKNVKLTEGTSGDRTSSTEKTGTSSSPDDSAIGSGSTASDSSAAQGESVLASFLVVYQRFGLFKPKKIMRPDKKWIR